MKKYHSTLKIDSLFDLDAALALTAALEVYARISFTRKPAPVSLSAQAQLLELNEKITAYCTKNNIDLDDHKAKLKNYIAATGLGLNEDAKAAGNYHDSDDFSIPVERKMSNSV